MLTNRNFYNEDCCKSSILMSKMLFLKIWSILERDSNCKSCRQLIYQYFSYKKFIQKWAKSPCRQVLDTP